MVLEKKFLQVGIFIREGMNKARHMVKENINGKMGQFMKEVLYLDLEMEKVIYRHQVIFNLKVYLKMI